MRTRLLVLAALLALTLTAVPATAKPRAAKRLHAFSSCQDLVGYARRHVPPPVQPQPVMPPEFDRGGDTPAVSPESGAQGDDSSQTNVQEAGVDEPDTVKTDGKTIFTVQNGVLHAVDARTAAPALVGTLPLRHGSGATLLLRGNRLLMLGSGVRGARMTEVDVADPARMRVLRTEDVDGYIVDARLTGRTARVVVASSPDAVYGPVECASRPSGWLPQRTVRKAGTSKRRISRAVRCRAVRKPAVFSGAGVLTVYTVDLAKGLPSVDADAVFTSGDTVYASPSSLFVATQRWDDGSSAR